jgi:hypothetical protein
MLLPLLTLLFKRFIHKIFMRYQTTSTYSKYLRRCIWTMKRTGLRHCVAHDMRFDWVYFLLM